MVELALELRWWVNEINNGNLIEFFYESMDFEDKPILRWLPVGNNQWQIYSIWQQYNETRLFSLDSIVAASNNYVSELTNTLSEQHSLNIPT